MIKHETPGALATLMGIALLSFPAGTWSSQRLCQCPEVTWLLSMHVVGMEGQDFTYTVNAGTVSAVTSHKCRQRDLGETWPVIMLDFTFKSHPLT